MKGNTTEIINPENETDVKVFSFDHSYWSFDGFRTDDDGYCSSDPKHKNGKQFCDQKMIFADVGQSILDNAWQGFNTSLFAYGQTGSGKSWSVIGYGSNKGIVPMFFHKLFSDIETKKNLETVYEIKFSMLEIYNEVVRDLLDVGKNNGINKNGLKIRQHPKRGFYADGLTEVMVSSYDEIVERMEEGAVNRTVASTNMNATSSRAHTIVGINFIQKTKNASGKEMAKGALINLVDLAGSERAVSTGATGDRLKEGAAINQSLSCLGNVIHALASQSEGKSVQIPYRDSVLTKLLQNALGGNSKTVMIAALSPADLNYDETLSTLRYADRAKQIKTKAIINEDPTEVLIRELREQNEKLRLQLTKGEIDFDKNIDIKSYSKEELKALKKDWMEEMEANLKDNEREMTNMKMTYEEKLKAAMTLHSGDHALQKIMQQKKTKAHIYNLNFDPQLNGRIVHILESTETQIGHKKHPKEGDISMFGPGIHELHAIIKANSKQTSKAIKFSVCPGDKECRILVNGSSITGETELDHNDRLVFGSTHIWVFQNPIEANIENKHYPLITYEYSQEEIASKSGVNFSSVSTVSDDVARLQEGLIDVMPAVEEANSISEELDKKVKFEIVLISPNMLGQLQNGRAEGFDNHNMTSTRAEVCVKMKNLANGSEFIWTREKFLNRLYLMKEMYNNYEEEDDWDLPEEKDPFQEDINQEINIGNVQVLLQTIVYMVEMKEQLDIVDLKGNKIGLMEVEMAPCDSQGRVYTEADDKYVDSPKEIVGQEFNFLFKIISIRGLPTKYKDVHCVYRFYLDELDSKTESYSLSSNIDFNHSKLFKYKVATSQLVDYLSKEQIMVRIMGRQFIRSSALQNVKGLSTKDMLKSDRSVFSRTTANGFGISVDPQKQSVIVELLLTKKTQARLQLKLDHIKKMLEKAEQLKHQRISTEVIKSFLSANTDEQMAAAIKQLEADSEEALTKLKNGSSSSVCSFI